MNNHSDLLLQLKDIHTRSEIGWQLAWGWWLVIFLVIIVLLILIFYLIKFKQQQQLKIRVKQLLKDAMDNNNPAIECLLILRSYADFLYPNSNIKTLNEKQWQDFLHEKLAINTQLRLLFSQTMYQSQPSIDKQMLLNYCQKWVDGV